MTALFFVSFDWIFIADKNFNYLEENKIPIKIIKHGILSFIYCKKKDSDV